MVKVAFACKTGLSISICDLWEQVTSAPDAIDVNVSIEGVFELELALPPTALKKWELNSP